MIIICLIEIMRAAKGIRFVDVSRVIIKKKIKKDLQNFAVSFVETTSTMNS